jgi:8-oxo-dGTP diphosphatase
MSEDRLHIAVGVVFRQSENKVLISKRPDNVPQGGLWEFPGGKCRDNENVMAALKRELYEELNLSVDSCSPLIIIKHDYPEQKVKLDVWSVTDWHGEIYGKEGQLTEWVSTSSLSQRDFPAANSEIIEAILLLKPNC